MLLEEYKKQDPYCTTAEYTEFCGGCGTPTSLWTQGNMEDCEYTTDVYIKCPNPSCLHLIRFNLPVN
jgi:NADH pyrophosphatase NudC (nudix superfamily)